MLCPVALHFYVQTTQLLCLTMLANADHSYIQLEFLQLLMLWTVARLLTLSLRLSRCIPLGNSMRRKVVYFHLYKGF